MIPYRTMRYLRRFQTAGRSPLLTLCCRLSVAGLVAGGAFFSVPDFSAPDMGGGMGLVAPAFAGSTGFIDDLVDVPLMPGLSLTAAGGAVPDIPASCQMGDYLFTTPAGSIGEAYAYGRVTRSAVEAFYAETLPQIGWNLIGSRAEGVLYSRESEDLLIAINENAGMVTVCFQMKPAK
ncbi:hypothetical protein SAMN05421779_104334 [Insolitispirillum peregrinum]|uniref:Uncharacterized protein n=2 Tax=Insolitispirillum peregrinum TaxID=80876 RepID=A0A1N7MT00_9PROT|nr:hypothetical protein SAMN05421779_104334 [Insolitispirillum peregrinum]